MNQVTSPVQTMSSREIAKLTGKRHPDVKRDIVNMFKQLQVDVSTFAHTYKDGANRNQTEYLLPRRECEILITGYDIARRAKVIDRWMELERSERSETMSTIRMIAGIANAMVEQEQQLLELRNEVTKLHQLEYKVNSVEHRLNTRCAKVGHIFATDARRQFCPTLSEETVKNLIELKNIPTSYQLVQMRGFETLVLTVDKLAFEVAVTEFFLEIKQETKTMYSHPAWPNKRFKA